MRFFGLVWGVALLLYLRLLKRSSVPLIDPRGVVDYFRPTPAAPPPWPAAEILLD